MRYPFQHWPRLQRVAAVVVPLAIGVAVAAALIASRSEPAGDQPSALVREVAVITAPEVAWRPRATGYGEARPARTWRAVAEISGRIVQRHPDLETGTILPAGTALYRVERTDYELAVAEAEAAISARRAQLDDLAARKRNLERALAIEQRRLAVAQRELDRQERLVEQDSVSQADVDRQRRSFLQQRQAVQEIERQLDQIPAERRRLRAQLERERAQLERARRDLARTTIATPIDLRVSRVEAEAGQYVRAGETLMRGDAVAATEVEAEVPIAQFRAILSPQVGGDAQALPRIDELLPRMGLTARIRLRASANTADEARWHARVDRISDGIDARSRTVGVVVVVDDPYGQANPPDEPPLVKGMYTEVGLCAPPREPAVVVPRAALHAGRIYVADADDRLAIREPEIRFRHGNFAVIGDGLAPGERVVVSDPVPAIAGLQLATTADDEARAAVVEAARGAEACP